MVAILAYAGIAGLVLSIATGILGFAMAVRRWPPHVAACRRNGTRPGFVWSGRYLETIEPEHRRIQARRGILLFGIGLAGAVIFFPLVMLAGLA